MTASTQPARPQNPVWDTPWRAFSFAFGMPNSFGLALALGAMALLLQIILGYGAYAVSLAWPFGNPLPSGIRNALGPMMGAAALFYVYFLITLYLASRFMDPEVRVFGGLQNLRVVRSLLFAAVLALFVGFVSNSLFGMLDRPSLNPWLAPMPVALIATVPFYLLAIFAAHRSLRWPTERAEARVPLGTLLTKSNYLGQHALMGLVIWLVWALLTAICVAVTIGFATSSTWGVLFFLVPFFVVLVSGYTMMIFAAAFVAPFRVAGWTLTQTEDLSSIFD